MITDLHVSKCNIIEMENMLWESYTGKTHLNTVPMSPLPRSLSWSTLLASVSPSSGLGWVYDLSHNCSTYPKAWCFVLLFMPRVWESAWNGAHVCLLTTLMPVAPIRRQATPPWQGRILNNGHFSSIQCLINAVIWLTYLYLYISI